MSIRRVALLTAGGFAPCLSAAIGYLIDEYTKKDPYVEIIAYHHGYYGLLRGEYTLIDEHTRQNALLLTRYGGSPIGNSRVKLTNVEDLVSRGLVNEGENPLAVAAEQLRADGVDVLHTIGGDDTNTTAADLAQYLMENDYKLTVVGLPKTIDNDIYPIHQSLGAYTAAEEASLYAQHIIAEHRSNPRMLIIHEVMGRNCGYLTAQSAAYYHAWVKEQEWLPAIGLDGERWDVHAVYVPEKNIDFDKEAARLKDIMDRKGNVNIFLSEGAGIQDIIVEKEANGEEILRDPFGHVKLDTINPGQWFAQQFAKRIDAHKVMVQKSGYFSRSWKANDTDLELIYTMVDKAVSCAFDGVSGVIGHDDENGNELSCIDFTRIKGGKPFDVTRDFYVDLLKEIGQE
ncbi:MAG: pyrophosphate--fructose-6-phosphate 1-phosphotransferase [Actinomycetaceae bacterium]|nr:pyrophosphate--fructose-6-phosphate 1-phosphotransferase [Actinomycetaceae bacterium]